MQPLSPVIEEELAAVMQRPLGSTLQPLSTVIEEWGSVRQRPFGSTLQPFLV